MKVTDTGRPLMWINRPRLKGMDMSKVVLRPNALDVLSKPSRIGNSLFYPDGQVVK